MRLPLLLCSFWLVSLLLTAGCGSKTADQTETSKAAPPPPAQQQAGQLAAQQAAQQGAGMRAAQQAHPNLKH